MIKNAFLASLVDAGIFGIESVFHKVTPRIVRAIPARGRRGIKGQRIRRTRLRMPPIIIMMVPAIRRMRRETKPMRRETKRSINI